jgi:hypothetical protein
MTNHHSHAATPGGEATRNPDVTDAATRGVPAPPVVTCTSTYYSAVKEVFAFEMFLPDVGQYFTVYAHEPDAYTRTTRYALTLTPLDPKTGHQPTLHIGAESRP